MKWYSSNCFEVTVHKILIVIALQRLLKHDFISGSLLLQFSFDQTVICMLFDRKKMWRSAARLKYTKFSYSLKVTVDQIFIELLLSKASSLALRFSYYRALAGCHALSAMLLFLWKNSNSTCLL